MPRRLIVAAVIFVGAVLVVALVAVAVSRPDEKLESLKADPMATMQPAGTSEIRRFVSESGTTLGKPVYPEVLRVISISGDPEEALGDAVRSARSAGWEETSRRPSVAVFQKSIDGMNASLTITVSPAGAAGAPENISGPRMTITLTGR